MLLGTFGGVVTRLSFSCIFEKTCYKTDSLNRKNGHLNSSQEMKIGVQNVVYGQYLRDHIYMTQMS